jgi:hypothetical protein
MDTQMKRLGLVVMLSVAIPASAFAQAETTRWSSA